MAANPSGSLPVQTGGGAGLKAAYRLLNEEKVTHAALSAPHWESVRLRAGKAEGPVLFVQDTTELDFTSHPATTGLGFVGNGQQQGLELQSCLCVVPEEACELVGLAFSSVWARNYAPRKKTETREERDARPKESEIWGDVVEAVGQVPEGSRWVSVSDRESDVFEFLSRAKSLGWDALVRSRHNRLLEGEDPKLHDLARSLPASARTRLSLRARPGSPARAVRLNLAWTEATLSVPRRTSGDPLRVWCVRVWEEKEDGLEWLLLTTVEIESEAEALELAEWYRLRWLVEEYHKCLKTGCRIQESQLESREGLEALLGFLGIVAVALLSYKAPGPCTRVDPELASAVSALSGQDVADPKIFLRELAKLGGFLGRKSDGEPGWQTIWKGWMRLQDILIGIQIAQRKKCG